LLYAGGRCLRKAVSCQWSPQADAFRSAMGVAVESGVGRREFAGCPLWSDRRRKVWFLLGPEVAAFVLTDDVVW